MNKYERIKQEATDNNANVIKYDFSETDFKGMYCDGTIALSNDLDTNPEKTCILAEELGHHLTSSGNILNQHIILNRKQEHIARLWAFDKIIGLKGIIQAFEKRCTSIYEIAEFLEVTEKFFLEGINCYKCKYGICKEVDNYIIFFEPTLSVMKKI